LKVLQLPTWPLLHSPSPQLYVCSHLTRCRGPPHSRCTPRPLRHFLQGEARRQHGPPSERRTAFRPPEMKRKKKARVSKGKAKVRKQDKQYTAQYNSGLVGTRDLISIMLNVFTNIIYQIYMKTKTNKKKENKGKNATLELKRTLPRSRKL